MTAPDLGLRVAAAQSRATGMLGVVTLIGVGLVAWRMVGGGGAKPGGGSAPGDRDAGRADGHDAAPPDGPLVACATIEACAQRCKEAGTEAASACVRHAALVRSGAGGTADHVAAREIDRVTCSAYDDARACTRLAVSAALLGAPADAPAWIDAAQAPLAELGAACDRGEAYACAVLELRGSDEALGAEGRARLCEAGDDRKGCAAEIAARVCREGDPEACAIAATPGSPHAKEALAALQKACDGRDLPACLYAWVQSGASDAPEERANLLRACTPSDDATARLPMACLAPGADGKRRRENLEWACEGGLCRGIELDPELRRACVDGPASKCKPWLELLRAQCNAGRLSGCAEALVVTAKGGMAPATWQATRARAAELAPAAALRLKAMRVPAAAAAPVDACVFGSARGCDLAAEALPAGHGNPSPAQLRAFAARLRDPLANP